MHGGFEQPSTTERWSRRAKRLVAASALVIGLWAPAAASAQSLYTHTPPPAAGSSDVGAPNVANAVLHAQSSDRFSLAVTGSDIAGLSVIGAGAVVTGAVLVRRARRRNT
jgi:hypothetical protein